MNTGGLKGKPGQLPGFISFILKCHFGMSEMARATSLAAQIGFLYPRIVQKLLTFAFQSDTADFQDISPVSQFKRYARVLLYQEDGNTPRIDVKYDLADLFYHEGRQPDTWFIHQHQLGISHQCASNRQHLLLIHR